MQQKSTAIFHLPNTDKAFSPSTQKNQHQINSNFFLTVILSDAEEQLYFYNYAEQLSTIYYLQTNRK